MLRKRREQQQMNGKNNWLMDFVINNDDLIRDISVDFPPEVDRMIAQLKVIAQDFPRQREIAAALDGSPSLEYLVQYRRRQFTSLWLQYACLPDEEKAATDLLNGGNSCAPTNNVPQSTSRNIKHGGWREHRRD
jgi:hypothetical protein